MNDVFRELVIKKQGIVCFYCGTKTTTRNRQVDHVHPQAKGGKDFFSNAVVSCKNCNRTKSARDVHEFIETEFKITYTKLKRLEYLIEHWGSEMERIKAL